MSREFPEQFCFDDSRLTTHHSQLSSGFTLVGIVVAIAILTILIAAVGPTVATIVQRDNEMELIFRGKQYARAIQAFQRRYGRYPNELKELSAMHPHTIRRLWRDPMCNCEDWQVIIAGSPEAVPMGRPLPGGSGPGGLQRTPPPPGNQPPSTYSGLFPPVTPPSGTPGLTPTPSGTGIFGSGPPKTVGPIVGVRSKVHKKALRQWRDRDYYDEWRFIAGDADNDQPQAFDPNTLRGRNFTPPPPTPSR